jgi:hypothetical protein
VALHTSAVQDLSCSGFQNYVLETIGRTRQTGDRSVVRPLTTEANITTERNHKYMPGIRSDPTIPGLDRQKTVHVLDRVATVSAVIVPLQENI